MADIAVETENNENLIPEKEVEEVDSTYKAVVDADKDNDKKENGTTVEESETKENGENEKSVEVVDEDSNEDNEKSEDTNGATTDAPEAIKRKADENTDKTDDTVASPEKKVKLDEVDNNVAETKEVAA